MNADSFDASSPSPHLPSNPFPTLVLEQMKPLHFRLRTAKIFVVILDYNPGNFGVRRRLAGVLRELADAGRSWQNYLEYHYSHECGEQKALMPLIVGCLATLFLQAERLEATQDMSALECTLELALERWDELEVALEVGITSTPVFN